MIIDVLQEICSLSKMRSQINFIQMNKHTNTNLFIYKIGKPVEKYKIMPNAVEYEDKIYRKISQNVITQNKFSRLKSLYISEHYDNILYLNFLNETLIELLCYSWYINNNCISKLNKLRILYAINPYVFDFDILSDTLEEFGSSEVAQKHIDKLTKLTSLECTSSHLITSLAHLNKSLKKLNCKNSIDRHLYYPFNQDMIDQLG